MMISVVRFSVLILVCFLKNIGMIIFVEKKYEGSENRVKFHRLRDRGYFPLVLIMIDIRAGPFFDLLQFPQLAQTVYLLPAAVRESFLYLYCLVDVPRIFFSHVENFQDNQAHKNVVTGFTVHRVHWSRVQNTVYRHFLIPS